MQRITWLFITCVVLSGCVPSYKMVSADTQNVAKGKFSVKTLVAWNKMPKSPQDIAQEESWTQNGPVLDAVTFMGAVKDGDAIAKQRKKDDRQVPIFKPNMTPPELVAMIESYYRIKAGATVFQTTKVEPVTFLGSAGVQVDYDYIGGDDVKRKGRSVLAVINDQLYLMALDGTALHYFGKILPEFESMVRSAALN